MKALIEFKTGERKLVIVNSSYSRNGIHYYDITINALASFLEFEPGERKVITEKEKNNLTYIMG